MGSLESCDRISKSWGNLVIYGAIFHETDRLKRRITNFQIIGLINTGSFCRLARSSALFGSLLDCTLGRFSDICELCESAFSNEHNGREVSIRGKLLLGCLWATESAPVEEVSLSSRLHCKESWYRETGLRQFFRMTRNSLGCLYFTLQPASIIK